MRAALAQIGVLMLAFAVHILPLRCTSVLRRGIVRIGKWGGLYDETRMQP